MARIDKDGLIRGKIGDFVYRNYRGKQIVQRVADETKTSEKVKKNNNEFGYASSKESAIRNFFIHQLDLINDGNLHNRHRKVLYELLIHNHAKDANERKLLDGNPKQYIGLNFNVNSKWEDFMPYYLPVNEDNNKLTITIPELYTKSFQQKVKDKPFDHLKLSLILCSIDPDLEQNPNAIIYNQREITLYQNQKVEEMKWEITNLPPNRFLLLLGKIEYFEMNSIFGLKSLKTKDLCPACVLYAAKF
ncbi:hypothetical protein [Faecalibacter bovis]|uniref:Uncharacterized protein n=1 Tax=Faecalibacter bovis TaxID=2898187 RepID=A0ABX7XC22_9FLAO|nr:hypothetical protein [Faecalibacter bovis]QTV05435.1 hypothetical protein J9309_11770 [Faecalibacter bovis]